LKGIPLVRPLPLFATGIRQEQYLKAIFRSLIDDQKIKVHNYSTDDSALVTAETFLLSHPDRYVAVVLETWIEDPEKIRETYYESGCRRMERSFLSGEHWHIALAIPTLKEWALIDDHVRQEYEKIRQDPATAPTPEERAKIERSNYYTLATKIGDWVTAQPFDLETLKQESRQVRELCTFIEKSLQPKPKPQPVPVTAADWF
jgi:hypothetical protein